MSMHEFEDIVEASVLALVKANAPDLRSKFKCLYDFQSGYDTGYTHFRVMEPLMAARFVYRFPLAEHPDHVLYRDALQAIEQGERDVWVQLDPTREWSTENPAAGYWKKPHLYVDAGSLLWQRFVQSGALSGPDAELPRTLNIEDVALEVVEAAQQHGDRELIAWWYAVLPCELMMSGHERLSPDHPGAALDRILAIALDTGAPAIRSDYGALRYPSESDLEEISDPHTRMFFRRWYEPTWTE